MVEGTKNYGIIGVKSNLPPRELLVVPHKERKLVVAFPAFGPNYFLDNLLEMQRNYAHPLTGGKISFRAPTTSESISVAAYEFATMAKSNIFDSGRLQSGWAVRTKDGIFVNPPKIENGLPTLDEAVLNAQRDRAEKIKVGNGYIYLAKDDDFGFAEFGTFKPGLQEHGIFLEGGLARILEHTSSKPEALTVIASSKFYDKGTDVWNLGPVNNPTRNVVGLDADRGLGRLRLDVDGGDWSDGNGYAFGVLDGAEGTEPKN